VDIFSVDKLNRDGIKIFFAELKQKIFNYCRYNNFTVTLSLNKFGGGVVVLKNYF
jgi:hypothetical protein